MAHIGIAVFLFLNFFTVNLKAEESIIDCTGTSNKTQCLQPQNYSFKFCDDFKGITLTPQDRNLVVTFHNNLREKVAKGAIKNIPKGMHMRKFTWNQDLAKLAKKWAEQCISTNSSDARLFQNHSLGRNIAIVDGIEPSKVNLERLMEIWSAGMEYLTPEIVKSYRKSTNENKNFETVAQMIWADTYQIGCSQAIYKPVRCKTEARKHCIRNRAITQLVCTYYPVGNKEGESIYSTSPSKRVKCIYDKTYSLLCGSMENIDPPPKPKDTYKKKMIYRMRGDFNDFWPASVNSANSWKPDFIFYIYLLYFLFINFVQ